MQIMIVIVTILLIFFFVARAVGVMNNSWRGHSASCIISDVIVSVKVDSAHTWVVVRLVVYGVLLRLCIWRYVSAPSQRDGTQDKESCFNLVHVLNVHLVL